MKEPAESDQSGVAQGTVPICRRQIAGSYSRKSRPDSSLLSIILSIRLPPEVDPLVDPVTSLLAPAAMARGRSSLLGLDRDFLGPEEGLDRLRYGDGTHGDLLVGEVGTPGLGYRCSSTRKAPAMRGLSVGEREWKDSNLQPPVS